MSIDNDTVDFSAAHRKAVEDYYKTWGVGNAVGQRHSFWNKIYPETYIPHIDTDAKRVKAFEFLWLHEEFPNDKEL